jgi:glycerol kinase
MYLFCVKMMKMKRYILALDQGTTSSRALLVTQDASVRAIAQTEFKQIFPKNGWIEHDANEIWSSQLKVAKEVMEQLSREDAEIDAIGITNQRETVVVWDADTAEPIHHAIVWQDKRTTERCEALKAEGKTELIRSKTGLVIDAYFSATKIEWILDHVDGARERAQAGKLKAGTIDSWLIYKLTDGKTHVTDVTNASRTLIFNINTLEWDEELLALFRIPAAMLPKVASSSEVYGHTSESIFGKAIPIAGIAGDQQSALFGQHCTEVGMVKNTYGTGCFMLMNIGEKPVLSQANLLTTIAWKIGDQVTYALEGSVFMAGAVVQWLRDSLGFIEASSEVEALAASVPNSEGVYFVPAFVGLGAPYWDPYARGQITGLTRGTTKAHIARAALDAIAFQTMDILTAMQQDTGNPIKALKVDGGASKNNLLMQFQADILQTLVIRPSEVESTALGAAFLAGLASGFFHSIEQIKELQTEARIFSPNTMNADLEEAKKGWHKAVQHALTR